MPKPTKGPRLGAGPAHERAIIRGLERSLILHGRIVTTEAKAKRLRPHIEKLITKARKGGLHNRRQALAEVGDRAVVHRLFAEVAPRTMDRPGGYVRILKLGQRRGDGVPMAIIELVDQPEHRVVEPEPEAKPRRRIGRRRGAEPRGSEAEAQEADEPTESPAETEGTVGDEDEKS